MIDQELKKFIKESLKEDIKDGDHTTLACIDKNNLSTAKIVSKESGTIAGIKLAEIIFKEVDENLKITSFYEDGDDINEKDVILKVSGSSHAILNAERLVLNCMQQMSAIATKTRKISDLISSTNAKILDTRKTIPLNRHIQKLAVKIGGGYNHRFGLYDMIMIKDNHIDFCNGITNAIKKTKTYLSNNNKDLDIIVETRNISEVKEVLAEGGIRRVLLDNFSYKDTKEAVKIINHQYETESSGGINEENILEYAKCGVDYISLGALTHSIKNFDISLLAE
ncbi:MAG: carboxylating nicotinate-nucleotide diphosphorylase [Flavobacteriales bacterium]|nr:carboxylating nicotinate-nucleotide diphosphorylase [Flavobacteriales bacterium]